MTIPTIYKSTDANAPVLSGTRTSLVALLTACLVTGYGAKAGAGWTRPFVNVTLDQAAFRSNPENGTGFFLRVDGLAATANQTIVSPYEAMTSETVGVFNFGAANDIYALISATASTTARPWVLIATDTWVYFFCYPSATVMPSTETEVFNGSLYSLDFFFGDYIKLYPDDAFNCLFHWSRCTAGGTGSGTFGHAGNGGTTGTAYAYIARTLAGVATPVAVCSLLSQPFSDNNNGTAYGSQDGAMAYSAATGVFASKVMINNGAVRTLRGIMPGVLAPLVRHPYLNLQEVTLDGKNYLYVMWRCDRYQNHGVAGLFFALSE